MAQESTDSKKIVARLINTGDLYVSISALDTVALDMLLLFFCSRWPGLNMYL